MAQGFYKIDIKEADFPMLSEQQTRTVMTSGRNITPPAGERPGLAYMHNMMPSKYGVDSVGFEEEIPAIPGITAGNPLNDVRTMFCSCGGRVDISWDSEGRAYALTDGALEWKAVPATVPPTVFPHFTVDKVTIATVKGTSYIFYRRRGCFVYDSTNNVFVSTSLSGLDISQVLGLVSAGGYLVAYTETDLAWSSTLDPTDFVPSPVTGAGGGAVGDIDGLIKFCVPNPLGFLIYTDSNVVAATSTSNVTYPFKFRPVSDSKGGMSLDKVAYEANSRVQFAYTKGGLQSVTSQVADTILPEVTDFLAGRRFEDFNEETLEFEYTNLSDTTNLRKKIKYISSRYLVISYGRTKFTHALIYDNSLNRLGKIKFTHTDSFEYIGRQKEVSKENIGLLTADGTVYTINFSSHEASNGVLILGKLQFSRTRMCTLLGVEVENVGLAANYTVHDRAALDGKNDVTIVEGYPIKTDSNIREHSFCTVAKNHSIVIIGKFNAVTVQVRYTQNGRR